jgi:Suppressor of fused protein (SUFU)
MDLEEVWRIREEEVYPALFSSPAGNIFTLSGRIFTETFGQKSYDPRWLFYGVIACPPVAGRAHWIYVTSGYSNPWEQEPAEYNPEGESGDGVEFLLQTTEGGDWAIRCLHHLLAFDLLLSAGRYPDRPPLDVGTRIALRGPINGEEGCFVRNMVAVEPEGVPAGFSLPSGKVKFLAFTGATDAEIEFAKQNRSATLIDSLRAAGYHPVTDPRRPSLY